MEIGTLAEKGWRLLAPLTVGKPVPCWYGPWVSNLGPLTGVVSGVSVGLEVKRSTPPVHPERKEGRKKKKIEEKTRSKKRVVPDTKEEE
jgi:hypothetical protein